MVKGCSDWGILQIEGGVSPKCTGNYLKPKENYRKLKKKMWKQTKNGYLPPFVLRSSSAYVVKWLTQALYSLSDDYLYNKLFIGLRMAAGVVRGDDSEKTRPGDGRLGRVTLPCERWLTSNWSRERRLTSDWSRERRLTSHRSRERGAGGGLSGVPGREVRRGVCGAEWE